MATTVAVKTVVRGDEMIADITRQIASRVEPRLHNAGMRAVDKINEEVAENTHVRAPHRRRFKGTPHLLGSFDYTLTDHSSRGYLEMEINLTSTAPATVLRVLSTTTAPHEIGPVNGEWMVMPLQPATAEVNAAGTHGYTKAQQVSHPGHSQKIHPKEILQEACDEAMASGVSHHRR